MTSTQLPSSAHWLAIDPEDKELLESGVPAPLDDIEDAESNTSVDTQTTDMPKLPRGYINLEGSLTFEMDKLNIREEKSLLDWCNGEDVPYSLIDPAIVYNLVALRTRDTRYMAKSMPCMTMATRSRQRATSMDDCEEPESSTSTQSILTEVQNTRIDTETNLSTAEDEDHPWTRVLNEVPEDGTDPNTHPFDEMSSKAHQFQSETGKRSRWPRWSSLWSKLSHGA
ncbi:hypothetical protein TREMEDRAFT_64931 [Tremella mesenterica DSM 1558]|uniref:uncharacterized protein n=1 Tax=Tremella mesenterica (strain ATCC 24925 / CBS 8224 / DSM 1558 / NBRC 9311 / NRRL Y-6157 / RJB 2259-6 / UBC 559-6) TaxID=578456 RepID=UPI0003F4A385|nr:uncharacterized protein TREMEDRAFT_64931 [Tremella mesenterica DSM 1558]EIW67061.1 hypothetical protein TREMEDRAFT_64931 [Tremella mesenterica DSM 1558]